MTAGLVAEIMTREDIKELRLDSGSKSIIFSAEGDADPDKYKEIVHKGAYSV